METCVRMLKMPVLLPHSLRTDWLLYFISHPPLRFPETKALLCEAQIPGDLFGDLLPSAPKVTGFHWSISSSFPRSVSLLLSIRC